MLSNQRAMGTGIVILYVAHKRQTYWTENCFVRFRWFIWHLMWESNRLLRLWSDKQINILFSPKQLWSISNMLLCIIFSRMLLMSHATIFHQSHFWYAYTATMVSGWLRGRLYDAYPVCNMATLSMHATLWLWWDSFICRDVWMIRV